MEIIDKNGDPVKEPQRFRKEKNLFIGGAITICGIIWMLYNFDIIGHRFFDRFFSWQMLLMVLGGYFLVFRKWVAGGILMAVGFAFALTDWFNVSIPVKQVILPTILIVAGLSIMLQKKY